MEHLLQNLQKIIKALETLSDKGLPQSDQLDELLDQLFQQKIDLQNLSTNTSAPVYQQASQALGQTAARADKATRDNNLVRDLIPAVNDAINKLAKLLNSAAS